MQIPLDYEEMLKTLNTCKVKYMIVGAYAVSYYMEPRFTKDIDIWVKPKRENAIKVYEALKEFGAPLRDVKPEDFTDKNIVYQIGVAPIRIDIMMDIGGVTFDIAWKNKRRIKFGKTPTYVIGVYDLIRAKKRSSRPQDILDMEKLKESIKK